MSYKYENLTTMDQSSSFFGTQEVSGSTDITSHFFQLAQKSRNVSNVRSFSKPSEFLTYSQQLEKEIKKTSTTLKKLNELTCRTTLFNNDDRIINDLIVNVKESISDIQKKIAYLQSNNDLVYSKQSEKMSKNIIELLNMRFMEITKEFKNALERRTSTIKRFKEKESLMGGSKAFEMGDRRNNKMKDAFKKKPVRGMDPEENVPGFSNGDSYSLAVAQENHDLEHLRDRKDSVKAIQKTLEEVMGIFQRISTMVQMHEIMIERIDKDTDDSLRNVQSGKKTLINIYKDMSSTRRLIISVMIFLMFFSGIYILII